MRVACADVMLNRNPLSGPEIAGDAMGESRDITEIYRLVRVLKVDTGGTVFAGEDPDTGEPVAIKLLEGGLDDPERRELFDSAMNAVAAVQHPAVPRCLGHGTTSAGSGYVVWELLEAETLEASDSVASDSARGAGLLADVADGVGALHSAGTVHGNLAPENVLVIGEGEDRRAVVAGLGSWVVRMQHQPNRVPARYLAPERLHAGAGLKPPTEAADVYALGVLVCEVLGFTVGSVTGPRPTVTPATPANDDRVDGPRDAALALAGVLELCLRRAPEQRPAPGDVAAALRRFDGSVSGTDEGPPVRGAVSAATSEPGPVAVPPPLPPSKVGEEVSAPPTAADEAGTEEELPAYEPTMVIRRDAVGAAVTPERGESEPGGEAPAAEGAADDTDEAGTAVVDRAEIADAVQRASREESSAEEEARQSGDSEVVDEPPAEDATVALPRREIEQAVAAARQPIGPPVAETSGETTARPPGVPDDATEIEAEENAESRQAPSPPPTSVGAGQVPGATVIMERPVPPSATEIQGSGVAESEHYAAAETPEWELDESPEPTAPFDVVPPAEIEAPEWELEADPVEARSRPEPSGATEQAGEGGPSAANNETPDQTSREQSHDLPASPTDRIAPPSVASRLVAHADEEEFDPNRTMAVSFEPAPPEGVQADDASEGDEAAEPAMADAVPGEEARSDEGGTEQTEPTTALAGEEREEIRETPPAPPPLAPPAEVEDTGWAGTERVDAEREETTDSGARTAPVPPDQAEDGGPEAIPGPTPPPVPPEGSASRPATVPPPVRAGQPPPPPSPPKPDVTPAPAVSGVPQDPPVAAPAPPPPEAPSPAQEDQPPVEVAGATERPGKMPSRRRWGLLGGIAAVVIVAVVTVVVVLTRGGGEPAPPESTAELVAALPTAVPAPTPVLEEELDEPPELFPDLLLAQQLLATGETEAARRAVETIPDEVVDGFGEDDFDAYQELVDVLAGAEQNELEQAVRTLRRGLKIDSPKLLRRAIEELDRQDPARLADRPDLVSDITLARRALEVRDLMWSAHNAGDSEAVLRHAETLNALIPGYSRIPELRSAAARSIEDEAEAAATAGDLERAISRLQTIAASWPDRPGLNERIEALRARQTRNRQMAMVLDRARELERARQPEQGLAALAEVTPSEAYRADFEQARQRLRALLTQMDQESPTVELSDDVELEFRKDDVVTLRVRVADDLRVVSVSGFCRSKGDSGYRTLPLTESGDGVWTATVGPQVHDNRTLELYVTATDPSGHVGSLGSAEAPVELQRKRWYQP